MFVAKTSTTATGVIGAFRLVSVEMWGKDASGSDNFGTVTCTFGDNAAGVQGDPSCRITDTGNITRLAHLKASPPAIGSSGGWFTGNASNAAVVFSMTYPTNTVIDVVLEIADPDISVVISPLNLPVTGVTAGGFYFNFLDNTSTVSGAGAGNLVPVGVASPSTPAYGAAPPVLPHVSDDGDRSLPADPPGHVLVPRQVFLRHFAVPEVKTPD